MTRRIKAYKRGVWAEYLAALYLVLKGYRIVAMRYKTPVGEIDILACKGKALVAVEVKARQAMEDALESVRPRSRQRIEKALLQFISMNAPYADYALRFDVIALCMHWPFSLQHLDNAWQARS
ncbi:MAG: YraN family protein [Alphaproteobacteria bacterium]|nr:YraN family protein [Alphaproteobacteria bacterium]